MFVEASADQASVIKDHLNRLFIGLEMNMSNLEYILSSAKANEIIPCKIGDILGIKSANDLAKYLGILTFSDMVAKETNKQDVYRLNKRHSR